MGKKKRHTREEVGAKLAQAEKLEAEGKLQNDIARSLGVSVMTLHRWRKMPAGSREMTAGLEDSVSQSRSEPAQVDDLKLENSRLRRLVRPSLLNICEHTVQPKKLNLKRNLKERLSKALAWDQRGSATKGNATAAHSAHLGLLQMSNNLWSLG